MHMRTTLNLDDELIGRARETTGIEGKTALIHFALKRLIEGEAARRLAAMGGMAPHLQAIPRRRFPVRKRK
jgi:Arc/MetJ family transcription regulator